jgi:hypothetical protein
MQGLTSHPSRPPAAPRRRPRSGAGGNAELFAQARLGEQAAWDQLVERYGAMVWAVARGHGLTLEDAADVSQVTWLLLTQHLGLLRQPERLVLQP